MADEPEATAFDAGAADDDEDEAAGEAGDLPEVIDLSGVQATTYTPVPRGTYPGWIESVEYGPSSKGTPMLTWTLKFMYDDGSEDADGNPVGEKERTVRWYTVLQGDGAGRTKAALAVLDPELDFATFAPGDMDAHFQDMEVNIRITLRPDRDDPKTKRNNVAEVTPLEEEGE